MPAAKKKKRARVRGNKVPKQPGVYCITNRPARKAIRRCVRRYKGENGKAGRVVFLPLGSIQCPKTCRRKK